MTRRVTRVPALPRRARDGHKGTFGTVAIVAGSVGMLGAAILCARGALRGGAGLVRAALPASLRSPFTVAVPSATTQLRSGAPRSWCRDADAAVVGPGLGTAADTRTVVRGLLRAVAAPIVLDADGLNALGSLRRSPVCAGIVVFTPHPGEAARLLATDTASVQRDRAAAALQLAERCEQIVVLKGAGTLVTDGRRLFRNATGNPGLGTGGSGDVLAGLLGALLAQGMDPFDAACLGVHVHGKAGDLVAARLSEPGLTAEDLPLAIAEVLAG